MKEIGKKKKKWPTTVTQQWHMFVMGEVVSPEKYYHTHWHMLATFELSMKKCFEI